MSKSILDQIYNQKMLVVGGNHADKEDFTLHLAVSLRAFVNHKCLPSPDSKSIAIYEYKRPQFINSEALYSIIRGEASKAQVCLKDMPRIFIFSDVLPGDFGFDLNKLHESAIQGNAYILLSTDRSSAEWLLQQSSRWLDASKISYPARNLADSARSRLSKYNLKFSDLEVDSYIHSQVADQLKTLSQVKILIRILEDIKTEIDFSMVDSAISLAKKTDQHILNIQFKKWDERERLLALGVSFFQGLPIDQLFAALENVVERIWQKRDPSLRALDCSDLDGLSQYCHLLRSNSVNTHSSLKYVDGVSNSTEVELTRLVLNNSTNSKYLYSIAWGMYRRQIVTALKGIAEIIKNSSDIGEKLQNLELFGNQVETQQLHETIRNTFSEIGLISPSATDVVRNIILELAADSNAEIRNFAARTVLTWFESNPSQFWSTLHHIYNGAEFYSEDAKISDNLGATTAIALGYACEISKTRNPSENLINWLREISENKSFSIKLYFGYTTLPRALCHYFPQLRDFVKKLVIQDGKLEQDKGLAEAIGWSLSKAYTQYPVEVLDLLEEWFQSWKQPTAKMPKRDSAEAITIKSYLANVLAITLSEINFSNKSSDELLRRVFNYLLELLNSKNSKTNEVAIKALCKQVENNFAVISGPIQEGISNLSKNEKNDVAAALMKVYVQERKKFYTDHQGDVWFPREGIMYRSWKTNDRPRTVVEETLLLWLGNKKFPSAQQLATQSFISFAREFEIDEEKFLKGLRYPDNEFVPAHQLKHVRRADNLSLGMSGLWAWLAISPSALPEMIRDRIWAPEIVKRYQPIVRNILPQASNQSIENSEAARFIVNKWKKSKLKPLGSAKNSPELTALASFLSPGLWMANNPWAFFLGIGAVLWGGHSITSTMMGSIYLNIEKSRPTPPSSNISSESRSAQSSDSSQVQPFSSIPTVPSQANRFDSESFPKSTCGDPAPVSSSDYPVSFYPVYINYSETNLNRVRAQFCADSIKTFRKAKNEASIQVSSFTSPTKAEEFKIFMSSRFGNSEVGEPRIVQKP